RGRRRGRRRREAVQRPMAGLLAAGVRARMVTRARRFGRRLRRSRRLGRRGRRRVAVERAVAGPRTRRIRARVRTGATHFARRRRVPGWPGGGTRGRIRRQDSDRADGGQCGDPNGPPRPAIPVLEGHTPPPCKTDKTSPKRGLGVRSYGVAPSSARTPGRLTRGPMQLRLGGVLLDRAPGTIDIGELTDGQLVWSAQVVLDD